MQPYSGGKPAVHYLTQRINGATPEQLVAMLLEGAQKFITQAAGAIRNQDFETKARMVNKVSAILEELMIGLNHEDGGELVANLTRIYEWWLKELFDASHQNNPERLEFVCAQIVDMRATWNQLSLNQRPAAPQVAFSAEGMVG